MKKIILTMAVLLGVTLVNADSCKDSPVKKEYKANEASCSYQTRTCCEDGNWSDWDKACTNQEGKCFNGSTWEEKPKAGYLGSLSASNINIDAIKASGSGLGDMIYSYPLKQSEVVFVNGYRDDNCLCTTSGWKCSITFKYQLLEATIKNMDIGLEQWTPCSGGADFYAHLWDKYSDILGHSGSRECYKGANKPNVNSDNLLSTCKELLSWAIRDMRASDGRFSKACGVATWSNDWYEHSTGFRSSKCKLYDLKLTDIGCTISNRQIKKSAGDSSSWFGE